jgi:hypothetical protein
MSLGKYKINKKSAGMAPNFKKCQSVI